MKYLIIILLAISVGRIKAQTLSGGQKKTLEKSYTNVKQIDSILKNTGNFLSPVFGNNPKPFVLVDRQNQFPFERLKNTDAKNIQSIEVIGKEKGAIRFGAEGKNGVLLITLKHEDYNKYDSEITISTAEAKQPQVTEDNTVYSFVNMEDPPTYPGGIEKFYKFLDDNIKYPILATQNKIQGNVFLSFTVEKDGSLTNIKIDRKLGYGTDEEALRVVKLSKRWNPGMQNGKPIRIRYNIPVKFQLSQTNNSYSNIEMDAAVPVPVNEPKADENSVYNFVSMQNPPNYPGGMEKFYAFLENNKKYPTSAVENHIQGNVFVSFIIEKDGSLTNIQINRKLGYGTDEEAIRLLKLSKRWNPGIENGKPVRVKYNIPIKFSLQGQ